MLKITYLIIIYFIKSFKNNAMTQLQNMENISSVRDYVLFYNNSTRNSTMQ